MKYLLAIALMVTGLHAQTVICAAGNCEDGTKEVDSALAKAKKFSIDYSAGVAVSASHADNIQKSKARILDLKRAIDKALARLRIQHTFQGIIADESDADILLKLNTNEVYSGDDDSVTLTAYEPENNAVVYEEKRSLVALDNDVYRLMKGFCQTINAQRDLQREANETHKATGH